MNIIKKITTLVFISAFIFQASYTEAAINSLEIISKNSSNVLGNDESASGSISQDGLVISYMSSATNLVSGDTNAVADIFVYDRELDSLERVSVSSLGAEGDGGSYVPVLSSDGRYVVFTSDATNLVAGDTNAQIDLFLHDRDTNTTELVSIAEDDGISDGESSYGLISSDGRYVVFNSFSTDIISGDTNGASDVFVRDRVLETTTRVSVDSDEGELDGDSYAGSISRNGRYVIFESLATNATDDSLNSAQNIYLRDLTLGTTELISLNSSEISGNDVSFLNVPSNPVTDDGRYVLFGSAATNLVSGDTNGAGDVFLRDRTLGTTVRISESVAGVQSDGESVQDSIDSGGRFISFRSESDLLVSGDTTSGEYDVFVYDMELDNLFRVSVAEDGTESNGYSESIGLFSSGSRYVVYYSGATNLVSGDTNGVPDVFLAEITDDDGISSAVEDAAPNSGDVNENDYDDAIEPNITSFVNSVSGNYTTVQTTGNCVENSSVSSEAESGLATQDSGYDYPLGIITFSVDCKDVGETATVSVYCFCENTPVSGTIARKYNESTGEYTTIDSAVIEEVTIDGQRALKMTYDVTDGGALDEDGLENGTIVDPVGFARVAATTSSGGSSSGSKPRKVVVQNTVNNESPNTPISEDSCEKYSFVTPMKKGSKFGEVSKLQELLNKKGISVGIVDGLFGPLTDMAVKQFQSQNSLDSDGIVGPMTRGVLNKVCK